MKSRAEYQREWRKKNPTYYENREKERKKLMQQLKINGCAICGYDKCNACLDFHHSNPEDKQFPLTLNGLDRTNENIIKEVNKCILLCVRCHRELHYYEGLKNENNN